MRIFTIIALATLWIMASCSNGCEETRDSMCGLSFTSINGYQMKQVSIYSLRKSYILDGKEVVFPDSTFRILNSSTPIQELRLDPNDKHTSYAMYLIYEAFGDHFAVLDTLDIWYTTETHYLDMECGCTVYFNLDSIRSTNNLVSNSRISNGVVSNTSSQINIDLEY